MLGFFWELSIITENNCGL